MLEKYFPDSVNPNHLPDALCRINNSLKINIVTGTRVLVTIFENKDIRINMIFKINTTTRL